MAKKRLSNKEIIEIFENAAAVLDATNAGFFRVRAYHQAIETIQTLDQELAVLIQQEDISKLPGIGAELAQKINELVNTGESAALNKLFSQVPSGMFPLLKVPGIGGKRAYHLATEFDLHDPNTAIASLKQAATTGKIAKLEGFGQKSEQKIFESLATTRPKVTRMRLDTADKIANQVIEYLKQSPAVTSVLPLGSIRRRRETTGDVDLGMETENPEAVVAHLKDWEYVEEVKAAGINLIRLNLIGNRQVDIKFSDRAHFGALLQHFTGSKQHNIQLRERAIKIGLSLSEHGIKTNGKVDAMATEAEFYQALNLPLIPPELREAIGEIEAADKGSLPHLVDLKDIKGDFHTHTDYSWVSSHDYGDKVSHLLDEAARLKYSWLVLSDHNPSRKTYSKDQIIEQIHLRNAWIEKEYYSWKNNVKNHVVDIFTSLEIDIDSQGQLSVPLEGRKLLDFVTISLHSNLKLPYKKQTERILRALNQPRVDIMAHPTARLINRRPSVEADWPQIFKAAAASGVALEINANPHRLDLPDNMILMAKSYGVSFVLGSDAHQAKDLALIHYGVSTARRGWLEKSAIINTYTSKKIKTRLRSKGA
jgi:DNA polymerase (family X)